MKKILYFSLVILFFSSYLYANTSQDSKRNPQPKTSVISEAATSQTEQKSSTPLSSQKTIKKAKGRNVANNALLSKADLLREDYYQELESEPIRREVNTHLQAISNLCKTKKTLAEKVDVLTTHFQQLRTLIVNYLEEPNLQTDDELFLRGIRANISIDRISYGSSITATLVQEVDIKNQFLIAYHVHYNLPESTPVEKFPDEWAKHIYNGLDCLYKK